MPHPVVITLVHHPDHAPSHAICDRCLDVFDKLGMERSGIHMRIPVRVRADALTRSGDLKSINQEGSDLDVIVFLRSPEMELNSGPWEKLLDDSEALFRNKSDKVLPIKVWFDDSQPPFRAFGKALAIRWYDWQDLTDSERTTRLLLEVVNAIRQRLGRVRPDVQEKIFVSHAKRDGRVGAENIVRHVNDPASGLHLDTFYDARQLMVGEDFSEELADGVKKGSLLALVSNAFDVRPWCNQEIIWAKEHRRPILLVDIGRDFVHRTFPYLGNVPLRRYDVSRTSGIERALLDLLCEALRCDLFSRVSEALQRAVIALPRPPELLDFGFPHVFESPLNIPIVYPDPPLPTFELEPIKRFCSRRPVMTLGELSRCQISR